MAAVTNLKQDQMRINEGIVRETAKKHLGHIYDIQEQKIGEKVVEDFDDSLIVVDIDGSNSEWIIERTTKACHDRLAASYNLDVHIPIGHTGATLRGRVDVGFIDETESKTARVVCAKRHLRIDRCRFDTFPNLRETNTPKLYAASVIAQGACCVGYEILMEIFSQATQVREEKKVGGGMGISFQQVGIGFDVQRINQLLEGEEMTGIRITAKAFGGFTYSINGLEEIPQIDQNFVQSYTECARHFYIRPSGDFEYYGRFPRALGYIKEFEKLPPLKELKSDCLNHHHDLTLLMRLEKEINESLAPEYLKFIKTQLVYGNSTVSLSGMFQAIEKIFNRQFSQMPSKNNKPYCLVLGGTGAGKSTLVGYLLGNQMVAKEVDAFFQYGNGRYQVRKRVIDYQSGQGEGRPLIGHNESETKGTLVYNNYMDAAGVTDTDGPPTSICNAIGTQIAVQYYQPQKFILVISPSAAIDFRASGLLDSLDQVCGLISDPEDLNCWPHILLVINDPKNNYHLSEIQNGVKGAIHSLMKTRNETVVNKDLQNMTSWSNKEAIEIFEKLPIDHPDLHLNLDVRSYQRKIEILQILLDRWNDNVVLADFFQEATRRRINEWLQQGPEEKMFYQDIQSEKLTINARIPFEGALRAAKTYFASIEDKKNLYIEQIQQSEIRINWINNLIGDVGKEDTVLDIRAKIIDQIKIFEETVKELNVRIEKLGRTIQDLGDSEEIKFLRNLSPSKPIAPRPEWAVLPIHTYTFEIPNDIPVERCEFIDGDQKNEGKFDLTEDQFVKIKKVHYTPARGSHTKNCNTVIKLFVKEKDLPKTRAAILKMAIEMQELVKSREDIQSYITDFKQKLKGVGIGLEELKSSKAIYEEHKTKAEAQKTYSETQLKSYENFRQLINQISKFFVESV